MTASEYEIISVIGAFIVGGIFIYLARISTPHKEDMCEK